MNIELAVALISGAVALSSAAGTIWSSRKIEQIKIEYDRLKEAAQRKKRDIDHRQLLWRTTSIAAV